MGQLNDKRVRGEKPRATAYDVRDGRGLVLRVLPSGTKAWCYIYGTDAGKRRVTLGQYGQGEGFMSLADAREAAEKLRKLRRNGRDPVAGRRARPGEDISFAELVEQYLEKYAKPRKRSWKEDDRILRALVDGVKRDSGKGYAFAPWGPRKAASIERRDILDWLDFLVDERGLGAGANRQLAIVRKCFRWALGRDLVQTSPCLAVAPPAAEEKRDRVLTDRELRHVWTALTTAKKMAPSTKLALRLAFCTGQRIGEILSMRWADIDGDVWTIPAERSKNGMGHRVPLPRRAKALLAEWKLEKRRSDEWVFPARNKAASGPQRSGSVDHALAAHRDEETKATLGIPYWRPHDARRTVASGLASLGVDRTTIGKVLNHAEPGVTAIYDRHGYDDQKRDALDAWDRRLRSILEGKKAKKVRHA